MGSKCFYIVIITTYQSIDNIYVELNLYDEKMMMDPNTLY